MTARRSADPATLFEAARAGDRVALPRLLSLVERGGDGARAVAGIAYRSPGQAYTVGITGAPGAGKSTLTDQLINRARSRGLDGSDQVAVLAIDPSSPFSGGAILGDRVRMQNHALDDKVFIRSMATRGHLGGLAVAVPDAVRVLSAVGVPVVLLETVGVGQQEVAVAAATDTTIVVVNPGWGDAIQANKAGLLEIADLFVINKADRPGARETRRDLELMLDLTQLGNWRPPIVDHRAHLLASGALEASRRARLAREFHQILLARVEEHLDELLGGDRFAPVVAELAAGAIDPYEAADRLLGGLLPEA